MKYRRVSILIFFNSLKLKLKKRTVIGKKGKGGGSFALSLFCSTVVLFTFLCTHCNLCIWSHSGSSEGWRWEEIQPTWGSFTVAWAQYCKPFLLNSEHFFPPWAFKVKKKIMAHCSVYIQKQLVKTTEELLQNVKIMS